MGGYFLGGVEGKGEGGGQQTLEERGDKDDVLFISQLLFIVIYKAHTIEGEQRIWWGGGGC